MRPYSQTLYATNPLPNTEAEMLKHKILLVLVLQKKLQLVHLYCTTFIL